MKYFITKSSSFSGSDYREVNRKATVLYRNIKKKTKRRPYVRSAFFDKSKVFLELFWQHLWQKQNFRDKIRRLRYFACAIELIECSKIQPSSKVNPNRRLESLHRFSGVSRDGHPFIVQIKENTENGEKWLISIFPEE